MKDELNKESSQRYYYDEQYYQNKLVIPYDRNESHWIQFFGNVAAQIVQIIKPGSVMDMGCAKGFLVESLRDRGVQAYGVDISDYAISQVREDIKQFCRVGAVTEPLDRDYDLITCIEVLEHVTEEESEIAIRNMAMRTQNILFSSSSTDFDEPSHINVKPVLKWLECFSKYDFYPDVTIDFGFIQPWSFLLRKRSPKVPEDILNTFACLINTKISEHSLKVQLNQLKTTVESQQLELNRIHKSFGGRLFKKGNQIKDTLVPLKSRRRRIYNLIRAWTTGVQPNK